MATPIFSRVLPKTLTLAPLFSRSLSTTTTPPSTSLCSLSTTSSLKETTIAPDACDLKHWLVVMKKPDSYYLKDYSRDDIIDGYVKTLAQVVGSKTISSFSEKLSEMDRIMRKMVLESLGVEKYLEEHLDSTNCLLRFMKYKGPQTTGTKVGLDRQTDKSIVTILYQNHVEGLEVLTKDGKWISYMPSSQSFVVMIGDSLHAWSNGRLHSPLHRVMMTGNKARYATRFFSIPKGGYMVKAPEELVDEEHPLLFKPFDHVEFLKYYYSEKGLEGDKFALRSYCGV